MHEELLGEFDLSQCHGDESEVVVAVQDLRTKRLNQLNILK